MHFRLAQFADGQHAALARHLQSDDHARHKALLDLKQRSVQEMLRTIADWKATGAHPLYAPLHPNTPLCTRFA